MSVIVNKKVKVDAVKFLEFLRNNGYTVKVRCNSEFLVDYYFSKGYLYSDIHVKMENGETNFTYDDMDKSSLNEALSLYTEESIRENIKGNFEIVESTKVKDKIVLKVRRI